MRQPSTRRRFRLATVAATLALFLLAWQGAARADDPLGGDDPVQDLTDQLTGKTQTPNSPGAAAPHVNAVPSSPRVTAIPGRTRHRTRTSRTTPGARY